jgi:hypothetical protein
LYRATNAPRRRRWKVSNAAQYTSPPMLKRTRTVPGDPVVRYGHADPPAVRLSDVTVPKRSDRRRTPNRADRST